MQKGKSLNDFKSGTPKGRFPSGGKASTTVKGLNAPNFLIPEPILLECFAE